MALLKLAIGICLFYSSFAQSGTYNQRGQYTTSRSRSVDGSRGSYDNTRVSESDSDYESSPEDGENDTDIENSCSLGESHTIIDASSSCCNHKIVLVHGLDLRKYWNECAKPLRKTGPRTNDLMEDHVNATRRVYSCILSKNIGERTVNLLSFGDMMTSRYPPEVRAYVMRGIKNMNSTKDVPIEDYDRVRDIRNKYFEIQRKICTAMDTKRRGRDNDTRIQSQVINSGEVSQCDEYEEAERNGGSCCKGSSVPLDLDYWRPPSSRSRLCNVTLAEQFRRWRIRASDADPAMEICMDACQLQPDGTKGTRFLENVKLVDFRDVSAYIRNILPRYFSQFMVGVVQNYARQHYRNVINENELMKTYGIDQETAKALKPCVSFRKLSDTVFDALHDYCFPAQNRNVRIQS